MKYKSLAIVYEQLEKTTKKLEKRDILAALYTSCKEKDLYSVVLLSMGIVSSEEIGIASEMMKRVIMKTFGVTEKELSNKFKQTGDLGKTAEYFASHRKQRSLSSRDLKVSHIFDNLNKLASVSGSGSQERKVALISELLSFASPKESRYIVRTTLGQMRIGVAAGIVRDAIALAFGKDKKDVEKAYDVVNNYGSVAEQAKKGRLKKDIQIGNPIRVMLAERGADLKEALEKFDEPAIEIKYDGFRMQIHKDESKIKIFSRRMDEVTKQFPEVVAWAKSCISARQCIVEGETLAIDSSGRAQPFQSLSRRIQRKYDIDKMVKEIPVQVNLFDLIYINGQNYMNKPLKQRWNELKKTVKEKKDKFQPASHIETKNYEKANNFYKSSLSAGQEGVIIKNLEAPYQPGKRVGYWLKVKEILEPLDLVIVGAEWGEGKRSKWLGSLILAARDGKKFIPTGRMASGLTDKQMEELTKRLKRMITQEHGRVVSVKPKIVIEVGYEEIQKSPKYPSGYALRFPRLRRIREPKDKGPEDINTIKDIKNLYKQQRGHDQK